MKLLLSAGTPAGNARPRAGLLCNSLFSDFITRESGLSTAAIRSIINHPAA
ncbi:MAG: hypothetical protein PHY12_10545 [Eubacteriales bacterium]|nr:hypothetical protein [Eubacteriales bacterium]